MKSPSLEFSFTPVDNRRLAALCGALDVNLRQIEAALDVSIARRGEKFAVSGERDQIDLAARALNKFYSRAHRDFSIEDIQLGLVELQHGRAEAADESQPAPAEYQARRFARPH
jgi:phosphate starvation-inducible protein PhoH and related proteins